MLVGTLTDDRTIGPRVHLTINLDGTDSEYSRDSTGDGTIGTGVIVFQKQGLQNTAHTLTISVEPTTSFMVGYLSSGEWLKGLTITLTSWIISPLKVLMV